VSHVILGPLAAGEQRLELRVGCMDEQPLVLYLAFDAHAHADAGKCAAELSRAVLALFLLSARDDFCNRDLSVAVIGGNST
jgi:hypothetical protein